MATQDSTNALGVIYLICAAGQGGRTEFYMSLIPFQKLPPRRHTEDARQYAYRIIRHFILNLHLPPGRKMNEVELADALSISRTPVHDTLYKLSRKNLVDVIPQKGAFVSRIDINRIEQTLWINKQLGTAMIQNIFIRKVKRPQFDILYHNLMQQEDYLAQKDLSQSVRLITEYYHLLYDLAGKMDFIWDPVQKAGMDLQRLLYLSASDASVMEDFLKDLTALTDALAERDTDRACIIYHHHLARILLLISPLKEHYPDYFIESNNEQTDTSLQEQKGLLYEK
ncbi:GntR family transcriptional regulator [Lacrimispora sp.]|uniref:GntR family transcriptional regulator n=1 Tax=Lacrimispora sp. TaxID=2719234 RepID=UPI002898764E|nr:GntR family transcriptional regulator [Lacrimispora sp.]